MKAVFRFIFSHSIFIACCAVAMCLETFLLYRQAPSLNILLIVFLSTICSYNFYWLISKWNFSRDRKSFFSSTSNIGYLILLVISFVGLLLLYKVIVTLWIPIVITSFLTLLYCLPLVGFKNLLLRKGNGFIKTFLLAFTWAVVTVVFPLWEQPSIELKSVFLLINRFMFVLLLCILFDLRDAAVDKQLSIYSIATDYPIFYVRRLWWVVFAVFVASVSVLFYFTGFTTYIISHLLTSAALAVVYLLATNKKRGYYFYYFVVDGLMLASYLISSLAHYLKP